MLPPEIDHEKQWKYAKHEFERRFLLSQRPENIDGLKHKDIEDKYLSGTRLRIRKVKNGHLIQYKLTKKIELGLPDTVFHWISTIYLSQSEFTILWKLSGVAYKKKRYYFDDKSGNTIGIDEIKMEGGIIWLAEVEFNNTGEMNQYQFPINFEKEVTVDENYSGYEIAKRFSN